MFLAKFRNLFFTALLPIFIGCSATAVSNISETPKLLDYETINEKDLYTHLSFIASDELEGRNTPSQGLNIAARYLASRVESYGFKPLNPNGSFFQKVPLNTTSSKSELMVTNGDEELAFTSPGSYTVNARAGSGNFTGEMVFLGYGVSAPDLDWDDYKDVDVKGKIVVVIEGTLPTGHAFRDRQNFRRIRNLRTSIPKQKGALGIIRIITERTEKRLADAGQTVSAPRYLLGEADPSKIIKGEFFDISIRHELAQELLNISSFNLDKMLTSLSDGERVESGENLSGQVSLKIELEQKTVYTQNVVAVLEGTDPILKNEYVFYGAHYDHVGTRGDQIWNGADDDGSGTSTLLEIAQAYQNNPQKRSIVMMWHCGEEKGLWGARWYTDNPLVPLENTSAQINLDMVGRNDNNEIFVIGAGRLSSELEKIGEEVNEKYVGMNLDYTYDAPEDKNNFYGRSDHYMYARYGIPVVFYFNDVHADYHKSTDTIEKIDFNKMAKVGKLAFLLGKEIANKDEMLKLDADPKVTMRGKKK